ncbi:MAG: hypothetical protein FJY97_06885, partial [candidate division Zixibacteria bacterium]|nr:hypothetical protein [candidate division Zixibacteria bacterium]
MEPSYRNYLEPVSTSFRLEPLDSVELECIDASGRTVPIKGQVCRATPVRLEIELAAVSVSDAGLQGGTPVFVAFVRQGLLYGFDTTDLAD